MQTMIELANIACVPQQIISPQSNKPVIGCIMDIVVGAMKLTTKDKFIDEETLPHLLSKMSTFNGIIPECDKIVNGKKLWSGRNLMSMILPDINYFKSNDEENIEIVNGKLVSGAFNKSVVGSSSGGLVHMISNDLNVNHTKEFLDNIMRVVNTWLKFEGFSVGFGDTITKGEVHDNIKDIISRSKAEVNNYVNVTYEKKIKISKDNFESKIFNILNKARDDAGSLVMKGIDKTNNLLSMVGSGSKGNYINISQIMAIVGQQSIQEEGKPGRIPSTLNNRTLPYFQQYDITPNSKGFIEHSYLEGLDVAEFFFHQKSGREGIIDTACKTSETGYIQRKLMKSLEDLKVQYDMTVRNEKGFVIQFAYGGDNYDPKKVEKQKFELIEKSDEEFKNRYMWHENDFEVFEDDIKINKNILKKEFTELKKLRKHFRNNEFYKKDVFYLPINVYRIVKQAKKLFNIDNNMKSNITPKFLFKTIDKILNTIKVSNDNSFPFNEMNEYNSKLQKTLIKSKLSSKVVIFENRLSVKALEWISKRIIDTFYQSIIHPGESVGSICAQSIGEPTTQLCLIFDTEVKVKEQDKYSEPKIGSLIEKYMNKYKNRVIKHNIISKNGSSYILPIPREWNIKVPGLNYKTQKVEWKRVTEFSKHPPNGKLIRIKTKSGRTVIATPSHSFVTKKNGKVITIRGDQLVCGDVVPIMKE
jgi:DNA-directed RNA polymerase II subunit RPB1